MGPISVALNGVFPLTVYMLSGVLVRRLNWMDDLALEKLNRLVFKLFLPILIALNIINSEFTKFPSIIEILFPAVAVVITFLIAWISFSKSSFPVKQKGVLIQSAFRSNYALFAVPLTTSIIGGKGSGITEILIAIIIPIYNILAVIALSYFANQTADLKKVIVNIVKNPLIIASIVGIIIKTSEFTIPTLILNPLSAMGKVATPVALMVLGSQFKFSDTKSLIKPLTLGCSLRLIIVPTIWVVIAIILGFRGETLVTYLSIFGSPVAVSSYTMSAQMGADDTLAGQILVFTSILSIFTLFIGIVLLKNFNLF
ncbi:MAG: AEC family transporter [Fastidiosipilaceae bacterium]|jgi:predicted permease